MKNRLGIKLTSAIDMLAASFGKKINQSVCIEYSSWHYRHSKDQAAWSVWLDGSGTLHKFNSWTAMTQWMARDVKRREILFRNF